MREEPWLVADELGKKKKEETPKGQMASIVVPYTPYPKSNVTGS